MKKKHKQVMRKVQEYLVHWQRELRLDGEQIDLRWIGHDEMTGPKRMYDSGFMRTAEKTFLTTLGVKHPSHRTPAEEADFNQDYEVIIVHELLHLRNKYWKECKEIDEIFDEHDMLDTHLEVAIDAIAEALVRARRGITR